jgi:hypothetical protein
MSKFMSLYSLPNAGDNESESSMVIQLAIAVYFERAATTAHKTHLQSCASAMEHSSELAKHLLQIIGPSKLRLYRSDMKT